MAVKSARSGLLGQVVQVSRTSLPANRAQRAGPFLRQFFANVPPSDLRGGTPDNLAGGALALGQGLQQRTPGKASVRAYNPDPTKDGWESQHSVIEIINDDMPFLVDSVTAEISRHEAEVLLVIHPVVTLRRDAKGKLLELAAPKQAVSKPRPGPATGFAGESVMQIQISEQPSKRLAQIADGIAAVLADVRAAVEDWSDMRERCRAVIAELETRPPMLPVAEIAERSEEQTSELQSLMRISYAVFCLKKNNRE